MSREQVLVVVAGAVALVAVLLAAVAVVLAVRARRAALVALAEAAGLAERFEALAAPSPRRTTTPEVADHSWVITQVGEEPVLSAPETARPVAARHVDGRLFADLVARETVVKAASLAHGVRRALDPEVRNRIRFEMRREVKRARRERRAELKAALRDLRARERAAMADDSTDDSPSDSTNDSTNDWDAA